MNREKCGVVVLKSFIEGSINGYYDIYKDKTGYNYITLNNIIIGKSRKFAYILIEGDYWKVAEVVDIKIY